MEIKELLKSMCVDDDGFISVADEVGLISQYSPAGKRVGAIGRPDQEDGTFEDGELSPALKGLACQSGDLVYVSDQTAGRVHVFDKAGYFVYAVPGADGGIALGPDNTLIGANINLGTIVKWRLR